MKRETLINKITDRVWQEFMNHDDNEFTEFYMDRKDRILSFIDASNDQETLPKTIESSKIAQEMLRQAITEDLKNQDHILLYTCRDNALISLDRIDINNGETMEDLIGNGCPFEKENGYKGKLSIGWD